MFAGRRGLTRTSEKSAAEPVHRHDVHAPVADVRGRVDPVEEPLRARADGRRRAAAAPFSGDGLLRADEVEEVGAFGVVELQRTRKSLEDGVGYTGGIAAFELGVVGDADTGE